MIVLHVEDDINWFQRTVLPELETFCETIHHASNYENAVSLLGEDEFDYIIIDQAIPLNDTSGVADTANGIMFADYVRLCSPGTPILILTGQGQDDVVEKYVEDQEQIIFWDGKPRGLVKSRAKRKLVQALELIRSAKSELEGIENIELELDEDLKLSKYHKRVIRIFSKHHNAVGAKVKALSGGLSSSKVLRITLLDEQGNECHFALAKIDETKPVEQDANNFNTHIKKLPVGSFPSILGLYSAGCGNIKGVFYQFASEYDSDYFDILLEDQDRALLVLKKVIPLFEIWEQAKSSKLCKIKDIRSLLCTDKKFTLVKEKFEYGKLDIFESKNVHLNESIQHADLHGKNILVSEVSAPIVIDYGDVALAPSVLDIVTLELSPFFHPSTSDKFEYSMELFTNWFNYELYIANSPFPAISRYLREVKINRAFLNQDYIATVYAYAVRQLSYEDTNHEVARILVDAAIIKFNEH